MGNNLSRARAVRRGDVSGSRFGVPQPPSRGAGFTPVVLPLAVLLGGCGPTYAPPLRSTHPGAAGRQQPGKWVVGGSGNVYLSGGADVSIPVGNSPIHAEVGADFRMDDWAMGYVGARATYDTRHTGRGDNMPGKFKAPAPPEDMGFAIDGEFGLGAGLGGRGGKNKPKDPIAFGGYVGLGIAGHFSPWFALWARVRLQRTKASSIPTTTWFSTLAGPEFKAGPVLMYTGGGLAAYNNSDDDFSGLFAELGIAVEIE